MLRGRKIPRVGEGKRKGKHKKQSKSHEVRVWSRRPNVESTTRKKLGNVEAQMLQTQEFLSLKKLFLGKLEKGEKVRLTGEIRTVQYSNGFRTFEMGVMFYRTYIREGTEISLIIPDCFVDIIALECKKSFFAELKKDVSNNRV